MTQKVAVVGGTLMKKKQNSNMQTSKKLDSLTKIIISTLTTYGVKKIAIFGSFARGEAGPESDIDIIVEFSEKKSLLDLVGAEQELTEKLGIKADLLTEKSISPYLIDRIKKEMKVIYQ